MKILVIGAGVIGSIYGYVLAQAGNDVTHFVRPGKKELFNKGINMRLLDGREKKARDKEFLYSAEITESFDSASNYDLILVSVRHYQLESVLPLLNEHAGQTDILFFNGLWGDFDQVEKFIPRSQFLWGFPVAGGGYRGGTLDAALLDEIRLGEIDGAVTPRLERIKSAFEQAGLKVDARGNMLHWLWVHFAINCGIIGAAFKAGGARELLNSIPNLRLGILAGRDALKVCAARGVNTHAFEDAQSFYSPALLGAVAVWLMMKTNAPARKIMERHTAVDELQRMYHDLLDTADRLNIDMPYYRRLQTYVDRAEIHNQTEG
ncbi:MAG: hypothetical protein LWX83_03470 [Anaerolineae bacterium]|nr:hypothetical protein [Anaerolineae bacterium]